VDSPTGDVVGGSEFFERPVLPHNWEDLPVMGDDGLVIRDV
jgi:hypothetical protein